MSAVIDVSELRAHLEDFLARAQAGERILVRRPDGSRVVLGPADGGDPQERRRRYPSDRTVAEVLAEDRGS